MINMEIMKIQQTHNDPQRENLQQGNIKNPENHNSRKIPRNEKPETTHLEIDLKSPTPRYILTKLLDFKDLSCFPAKRSSLKRKGNQTAIKLFKS